MSVCPTYKPPFPYFGGKSRVADMVWSRFGECRNYVEPFFGSGAMLFRRPQPFEGVETVNDADGLIANFWRATQHDPEAVAAHADWPVNENDLHARHAWLVEHRDGLQARLEGDPEFYDAKVAGWWAWGCSCWIGSGWCSGKGPWQSVVTEDGSRQLVHLGDAGRGVNRQLVHLGDAGRGVNRQLVHLGNAGRGVNRQLVHLGNAGRGVNRQRIELGCAEKGITRLRAGVAALIGGLADRLQGVRVCCGDWSRVCGDVPTLKASTGLVAVFLDPPYADTAKRDARCYRVDSLSVAHAVREWAIERGSNPRMRIALCGYDGEHEMPPEWECVAWKTAGGYGSQSKDGYENKHKERIWFSPACLKPPGDTETLFPESEPCTA